MACGKAHVGVQRGSEAPQQGDGGLGAALLDALDLVGSHFCAQGEIGDAQAEGARRSYRALPKARASRIAIRSGSSS